MNIDASPDEAPLRLTGEDLMALDGARGWARFCYLLAMALVVRIALIAVALAISGIAMGNRLALLVPLGLTIPLGVVILYAILLRRYSKGIADHLARDGEGLVRAFRALKGWWIYMVVMGAISVVATLIMILAQLAGFKAGAGP